MTEQLDAYFAGHLRRFDLPLDLQGTSLQRAVWRALLEIPYGETATYGEQAARIDPTLFDAGIEPWQRARVVGAANGRNPVAIVVPKAGRSCKPLVCKLAQAMSISAASVRRVGKRHH